MKQNFDAALAFVWRPGFDDPSDGYHVTPGDPGGGTMGGVTEATWASAIRSGLQFHDVPLKGATKDELSAVLRGMYWGDACDALPSGIDLLLFNGRMMTGHYPKLFQCMLGLFGADVDGVIGPETIAHMTAMAASLPPLHLAFMLTGAHLAYLSGLPTWAEFGHGWENRILAADAAALTMITA